ncbi:MAG: Crp/Fnr family transcriptional regulator [Burkholderiales bacterium]|nr:Crp/Fnr family transcriptional regulator [Burkholderiales bacterium]
MAHGTVFRDLLATGTGTGTELPEWPRVAQALVVRRVEAGGTVFLQDAEHPYVYAVGAGLLKLCYLAEDGTEWIKSFASEGGFFASIAALQPGGRTSFMVTAIEDSVLERLDHRLLDELSQRHLAWSRALQAMTLAFAARKEARERALLTLDAQERYLAFCAAQPDLARRIPQKDLARHLGVTPVGLNRIVMRLRRLEGDPKATRG